MAKKRDELTNSEAPKEVAGVDLRALAQMLFHASETFVSDGFRAAGIDAIEHNLRHELAPIERELRARDERIAELEKENHRLKSKLAVPRPASSHKWV